MSRHNPSKRWILSIIPIAVALRAHGEASGACAEIDGAPPGVDCTEYMGNLELQAQRLKLQAEIEAYRQQIAEARRRRDEASAPVRPPLPVQPNAPTTSRALSESPDRVYEVFGDFARIRYRGAQHLVHLGQRLDPDARVVQVSLDGVVVAEGKTRRTLPFLLGD